MFRFNKCFVLVVLVLVLYLAGNLAFAANKPKSKNLVKSVQKLPEAPTPFGLVFGKTIKLEALQIIKDQGGNIQKEGERQVKDAVFNPSVTGVFLSGVKMEGATDTRVWFFNDNLMMMSYELSGSFKTYYDQLRERYGAPSKFREGFGGEAYASWKFKDLDLELNRPFMGSFTMSFVNNPLWEQANKSDTIYYAEVTRQKAKSQKGF